MKQDIDMEANVDLSGINSMRIRMLEVAKKISPRALSFAETFFKHVQQSMEDQLQSNAVKPQQLFPWKYELKTHFVSPICSKRVHESKVKTAFSCFDCRECDNSILCYECFSQSNHDGHRYNQFQTTGGCCDCGDIEAWNQKGFCKKHGHNIVPEETEDSIKQLFCAQIKFAFFLYLWLVEKNKVDKDLDKIRFIYGAMLLQLSANLVSEEYQLKYLLNMVLQSRFTEFEYIDDENLTIIERFFRLQYVMQLSYFNKISLELFPVEQFRYTFIKQYFYKTFRNEMPNDHPLRQLNYQYMGRAKIIKELIERGELHPLMLNRSAFIETSQLVLSLYRKYIDDFTYLIKPKSATQYFKIHFERANICDMLFFREYTQVENDDADEKIVLDEYFLKIYAEMLKIVKHQKPLLQKIMKELIEFIANYKKSTYSLVHERTFALTAMAYLEGSLSNLQSKQMKDLFISSLGLGFDGAEMNAFLERQIERYLKDLVRSNLDLQQFKQYEDDFSTNFKFIYPQRYLLESLDSVYMKILMRLYEGKVQLDGIIMKVAKFFYQRGSAMCIFGLMPIAVSLIAFEVDEAIVCDQIGGDCRQKIFSFFKRFLKSYPILTAKDLKYLSKRIINNDKIIDQFLINEVKIEKGRIVSTFEEAPLETFIYKRFFEKIQINIFKAVPAYFNKIPRTLYFQETNVYNEITVVMILRQISTRFFSGTKSAELLEREFGTVLEDILLQLALCYAETGHAHCKLQFDGMMDKKFKSIRKEAIDQATLIFHPKQNGVESPLKLKELEDGAKKKETLLKKRKEKEELMKKRSLEVLKNYESAEDLSSIEACIYCKQNNNIDLYFVAYCNFSSIYEQKCLKIQSEHIFFQTCGHKIHQQCYEKYLNEVEELNVCFLCKKPVNILAPYFREGSPIETQKKQSQQFIDLFYPILLRIFENKEEMVNLFYCQRHEENIIKILIESFVREVALRSLYDISSFQRQLFPIYSTIFEIFRFQNEQSLSLNLQNMAINIKQIQQQTVFKEFELILIGLLQSSLLKKEQAQGNKHEDVRQLFSTIIRAFQNKVIQGQQLKQTQICDNFAIVKNLPLQMIDLLPLKPKCLLCGKLTNRLLGCLLCDWIGCDDDTNCMKQHTEKEHIDGSVFVFLFNGQIIYSFQDLLHVTDSIYYDYLGDSLSREKRQFSKEQLLKYYLNVGEFNNIKKLVIQHMIHHYASK